MCKCEQCGQEKEGKISVRDITKSKSSLAVAKAQYEFKRDTEPKAEETK